jgi:hypothetical protein
MEDTEERLGGLQNQVRGLCATADRTQLAIVGLALATAMTLIPACATPLGYTDKPLQVYDKDTSYRVDDRPNGFTVTASYSRYQFVPESDVVAAAGRSALIHIANDLAKARGRGLVALKEDQIRWSMGRNGFSGITSWSGTADFDFTQTENPRPTQQQPTSPTQSEFTKATER